MAARGGMSPEWAALPPSPWLPRRPLPVQRSRLSSGSAVRCQQKASGDARPVVIMDQSFQGDPGEENVPKDA